MHLAFMMRRQVDAGLAVIRGQGRNTSDTCHTQARPIYELGPLGNTRSFPIVVCL